jgi:protein-L-isoaspartate(D-aspartate) O-methyltransferase
VAAGAPRVPEALVAQLAPGGRLVVPVGDRSTQVLVRVTAPAVAGGEPAVEELDACRFVDLVGAEGWPE